MNKDKLTVKRLRASALKDVDDELYQWFCMISNKNVDINFKDEGRSVLGPCMILTMEYHKIDRQVQKES
jgi:hypothetical protein